MREGEGAGMFCIDTEAETAEKSVIFMYNNKIFTFTIPKARIN